MSKDGQKSEGEMSPKERAAAERAERLRKQLRGNLQRRKEQSRARNSDAGTTEK